MTSNLRKPTLFELALWLGGGVALLFIVAPLAGMVWHCRATDLGRAAVDPELLRSVRLTLLAAAAGTLAFAVPAVPFAWLLARKQFIGKQLVLGLIDLPVVVPHTAAGIALLGVLSRDSLLGGLGERFGCSFIASPAGVALAMAYVSLPFLLNAARDGFAAVPERLEKTALTLGASPARVFFTISLPLASRAILTGGVLMFARGLSEFGAVIIIAYHPMITPILIYERFTAFGLAYARPAAVLFLAVCLGVFILLRRLAAGGRHVAR